MVDPEQKRAAIEKAVKAGVIIVALAVAGPVIWMALEGALALAALGAVGLAAWGVAPALGVWVANKRIQALVAVIEANPIETMQNLYADKFKELNVQAEAVRDFNTEFLNVNSLVEDLKKTDPEESEQYAQMRDQMKVGLEELYAEQHNADAELTSFKLQIDKARRIWKVSLAMNKALEKSQSAQARVFADIKQQVAFDTVRGNLNKAFANLNAAVERRKSGSFTQVKTLSEGSVTNPVVKDLGKVKVGESL